VVIEAQRRVPPEDTDVAGRVGALTTLTPVRWWGVPLLRSLMWVVAHTGVTLDLLRRLAFIEYARWGLVKAFPANGTPQGPDPRRHHHLYFESNFNGTLDQYLDTFAYVADRRFWFFWGSSYRFPARVPAKPFRDWIRRHHTPAAHYYSAYPDASATMVVSALELERELKRFAAATEGLDAAGFRGAYDGLLTRMQGSL
jgi:hypothetical protein